MNPSCDLSCDMCACATAVAVMDACVQQFPVRGLPTAYWSVGTVAAAAGVVVVVVVVVVVLRFSQQFSRQSQSFSTFLCWP